MNILENTFDKSKNVKKRSIKSFVLFYIVIIFFFLVIGPWVFSSDWVSSSDFHSCIEIIGSFIALIAGVACLMYFFGLNSRFFLITGLAFFIAGSEDLVHGILAFQRLFSSTDADFSRFVPGTYVAGRMTLAIMIIAAPLLEYETKKLRSMKHEAIIFSSIAIVIGGGLTALAFTIRLPQFIYPNQLISRPVDFISAMLFLIAFPLIWKRYTVKRDTFSGMLLASILFNLGGQVYMSFSKQLFDVFFDLAHYANVFSYITPVFGISLQGLEEMRRSNRELVKRKQVEKELQDVNEQLETRVRNRTSELKDANQKLEKKIDERKQAEKFIRFAYEELERTNNELKQMQSQLVQNEKLACIGQLAAGVAHEMNTPVGFVASNFQTLESYLKKMQDLLTMYDELIGQIESLGKTELLNKANAVHKSRYTMKIDFILEDIHELFDDSREGLERITDIIQNLKDFSRIDQPGSLDEYDINSGIETTLVMAMNEIKYDANVEKELSEVPIILCNAGQINQVFLNILVNAAQAIKSQERDNRGTITIRTYATDDKVVCEISDDGPGIAPDMLSKVFDPFFTTKPTGKGTGLGLSVSYDIIVNKHNGKLLVNSTVGEGARFTIKLPISRKEEPNNKQEIESNGKKNGIICG